MKKRVKNKNSFYFLGIAVFTALVIIGFVLVSFSNKESESKNIFQKALNNIEDSYLRITGKVITGYVSCGDSCVVEGCQGIIKCTSTSSYCDIFPGCCNSPNCPGGGGGSGGGGDSGGGGSPPGGGGSTCSPQECSNNQYWDSNQCKCVCKKLCTLKDIKNKATICSNYDDKTGKDTEKAYLYECMPDSNKDGCPELKKKKECKYGCEIKRDKGGEQLTSRNCAPCVSNCNKKGKTKCAFDKYGNSDEYQVCQKKEKNCFQWSENIECSEGLCDKLLGKCVCYHNGNCKDRPNKVCDTREELYAGRDIGSLFKPNPNYRKCSLECDAHVNIDGNGITCPEGKICDLRKKILYTSNPDFGKCSLECVSNNLDFKKYGITCIDKSGFKVCDDNENSKTYGQCKFECNGNDPSKDIICNNVLKPYCDIKDKTCKECISDFNCPKGYWCNKGKCVNDPVKCCIGYLEPFESPENDFHDKICSTLLDEDSCRSNSLDCVWKEIGYPPAKGCVSKYSYNVIYDNIHKDSNSKKCDFKAILPMYMDTQSQLANFFQKYNCKEQRYYFIYHGIKEDCKPYFDFFKQCMKCSAGKCNLYEGYHHGCSLGGDPKLVDQEANELRAKILEKEDYKTKVELSMNQMASTDCAPTTLTIIITANSITKKYFSCSKIEEYNSMPTGKLGKRSGCSFANKIKGIRYEKATCTAHDGKNYMVMCCPKNVQGNEWELEYVHPDNPVCKINIG